MTNKKFDHRKRSPRRKDKDLVGVIEVKARRDEEGDSLIRRFKRKMKKSGLQTEIRSRYLERFKTKSEKRREKHRKAINRALSKR